MAVTANPLVPVDGTLLINDGAALSYTIVYEDGDFSASNIKKGQKAVVAFRDRGATYSVREMEDEEIEFSFSAHAVALLGDGTTAMPTDVVAKKGVWAAATSLLASTSGDAYLLKLTFTGERSNFGATNDTTMVLKYCHCTIDFAEGSPGKFSVKGKAFIISTDYLTLTG
jgi:hypothetical protein